MDSTRPPAPIGLIGEERCELCKFCKGIQINDHMKGLACFRMPPQLHIVITPKGPVEVSKWPMTDPNKWCGEFKRRLSA